jgi:HAD superfamily hydrolase (TIGR01459 family)
MKIMQVIPSFSSLAQQYDAFLCDLWGVIHDGETLYPHVLETLENLHQLGKPLVFLSNAPRLADSVIQRMTQMGVKREWYLGAMTSGEAARHYLQTATQAERGHRFFYQGLESDAALLTDLPQQRVERLEDADFILNGNFDYHGQPLAEILPRLEQAIALNLPMLCINPDLEVVKQDGSRILCAGYLAAEYHKRGGKVESIGKPYPLVYHDAQAMLPESAQRIVMVGDNLLTDIQGGKAAKLSTALVTQGVLCDTFQTEQAITTHCHEQGIVPDYVLDSLKW